LGGEVVFAFPLPLADFLGRLAGGLEEPDAFFPSTDVKAVEEGAAEGSV
jgi:hypothetical protein